MTAILYEGSIMHQIKRYCRYWIIHTNPFMIVVTIKYTLLIIVLDTLNNKYKTYCALLLCAMMFIANAQWIIHSGMFVEHATNPNSTVQLCNTLSQNTFLSKKYINELQALGALKDSNTIVIDNCSLCELTQIDIHQPSIFISEIRFPERLFIASFQTEYARASALFSSIRAPPALS